MKALCFVLDSDPPVHGWAETYEYHRSVWRQCIDVCRERCPNIDIFFLRSNPDLSVALKIADNSVEVRGPENFDTVLHKIQEGIGALLSGHDYVIQTGLSSMWDFPLFEQEPVRNGVYAGHVIENRYISGAGIILSNNAARIVSEYRDAPSSGWQDEAISDILSAHQIHPEHREMFSYNYAHGPEQLETRRHLCYRVRDYHNSYRVTEREVMARIFSKIYG